MSVFRYGLVGPNFQPNLLSERASIYFCGPVERKGKWLIFHYSSMRAIVRWRHSEIWICLLVDCRTQQTFRVFLTKDFKSYITKTDYQLWLGFCLE